MDQSKEIFYDKEKKFLLYLLIYISRFFMTDEEIVIFDLFVHNECLYLEKDITNCVNINEQKTRSILAKFLKERFIIEVQKKKNNEKGSSYQTYYCLNNYIVHVIDFKIKQMEIEIQKTKNDSDVYICTACKTKYSQMDAQMLPLDPYDAHFLCICNSKLELIDKEDDNDEQIYNKYTKYLNILKEYTEKLKNYFIPVYTEKFNRNVLNSMLPSDRLSLNALNRTKTTPSSDVSVTNHSSQISKLNQYNSKGERNEDSKYLQKEKEESINDNCSSVIRNTKKIKICMNTKNKLPLKKKILNDDKEDSRSNLETENRIVTDINEFIEQENNITHFQKTDTANGVFKENTTNGSIHKKELMKTIPEEEKHDDPMECPRFFIQKFKKDFTLLEAQKLQQEMSQEEFERFVELQETYLDYL